MAWETLLVERDGPLAVVTLYRPQVLNAMNAKMVDELFAVFEEVESDPEVRVLLITGHPRDDGRPCFSSGADIKEETVARTSPRSSTTIASAMAAAWEVTQDHGPRYASTFHHLFTRLESMSTPSIAVVDGICTTGGLELILSCDLRVVAETAQVSDWHIQNMGGIGGAGSTTRLPQVIGTARAKEMLWTGIPLDGNECYRVGLANKVFPAGELMAGAKKLANVIATRDPVAVAAAKAVVDASLHQTPQEGIRYSYLWSALASLQRQQEGREVQRRRGNQPV